MKTKLNFIFIILILNISCAPSVYIPPSDSSLINNSRIINKNFDETWSALIAYAGTSFFSIDNFEKNSGLMILNFSTSNPADFITGGYYKSTDLSPFDGDFVAYMEKWKDNTTFNGKMNIVVQKIDDESTKITINARYVYTLIDDLRGTFTWSFDTAGSDEIRMHNSSEQNRYKKLMPTYLAESTILDAIDDIANID